MTEIGIIVGRRHPDEILAAFLRRGHDLRVRDASRGEHVPAGRHPWGALRIHDDAEHTTFRSLCPFPHSIVEASGDPALAGSMREVVHAYDGFVRDARGEVSPSATPEGDNPDFDLLRRLRAIEGLDHRAVRAVALLSAEDPEAFRALAEAVSTRTELLPAAPAP